MRRSSQDAYLTGLRSEYGLLLDKLQELNKKKIILEGDLEEIISLYEISKDMSKELDDNRIFSVFKERVGDYIKLDECLYIKDKDLLKEEKDSVILPLDINKRVEGYIVASGLPKKEKGRFYILAQQLMIMLKRSMLFKMVQEMAIIDGLTKLFCRRHFLDRLEEEIKRSDKFKYKFSFLMIDIDRFKSFNDKYGHLVGDVILREVSRVIKDSVRQIDFAGRYGGEELSLVLPETDKEQAFLVAERIREMVEAKKIRAYDEEVKVTVSIGVASFPDDSKSAGALIEKADLALYSAKKSGRNRASLYLKEGLS
ncbi:MAG: GGDEF domain-containing protein [Candidatus Omnitrophota bacterium]